MPTPLVPVKVEPEPASADGRVLVSPRGCFVEGLSLDEEHDLMGGAAIVAARRPNSPRCAASVSRQKKRPIAIVHTSSESSLSLPFRFISHTLVLRRPTITKNSSENSTTVPAVMLIQLS
jgi:hypothetical protein